MRTTAAIIFLILITVWAGIVIGVSLIATPVKFQAPSLTMPVGLEIGRYTFRWLSRIDLCLLIAAVAVASVAQLRGSTMAILAVVVAEIALQRYWLLPALDMRVSQILAGGAPSFSIHHNIYAVMEATKAALLIMAAALEYRARLG